jgi:hypothetical protein
VLGASRARPRARRAPWWPPEGVVFRPDAGERAVTFIERYCRHYEGEWAGELIVLEEWQRDIYRAVFGWMRADGTRRFRTAYIEIPRKNGKSVKGSATGIYLTVADDEGGAQVYSAATKKDQAKITHTGACRMIKASPDLKRFLRVMRNNISCARLGSKFEPLGADSGTLDGLNTHGLIEDETHAHKDRHVHDVIVTSMGARRQPLAWIITTAGVYDPGVDRLGAPRSRREGARPGLRGRFVLRVHRRGGRRRRLARARDVGEGEPEPRRLREARLPRAGVRAREDDAELSEHLQAVSPQHLDPAARDLDPD